MNHQYIIAGLRELENLRMQKRRADILESGLRHIAMTIEKNNQQNGFWGVASAHGIIRITAIETLEKARKVLESLESTGGDE